LGHWIEVIGATRKMERIENVNPKLYRKCDKREITPDEEDDSVVDPFDSREVFGILWIPVIILCLYYQS